ncbi:hypothetical protein BJY52DRAFT_8378 [Lactarius psammicola]|nr:hypothetical protein BJY52DRAFT_8378 [Lactarius psammicola]
MADTILSAKSGRDWTENELIRLFIRVDSIDAATFFNTAQLPDPPISHVVLTNERRPQGPLAKSDRLFFHYLKDAMTGEESFVEDFAAFVLHMFEYDEPERIIHQRKELSFVMCGTVVNAKPNICVMSGSNCLLLVQEGKRGTSHTDPEPQLIAGAIATFYQNNIHRKTAGRPPMHSQIIPGIIMVGAVPTFYRIPVTANLVNYVQAGTRPSQWTVVQRCVPPVPNQDAYPEEGLVPLANRNIVMQCYEAFKAFV